MKFTITAEKISEDLRRRGWTWQQLEERCDGSFALRAESCTEELDGCEDIYVEADTLTQVFQEAADATNKGSKP